MATINIIPLCQKHIFVSSPLYGILGCSTSTVFGSRRLTIIVGIIQASRQGTAIVFVQLLNYVLAPIETFPSFYAGMKSSFGLIGKLAEAQTKNVPDEGEHIAPQLISGISIRDLAFSYEEGKPVLEDVDMELTAGGCYALVGGSGSGKSTLLNLLMASSGDYRGEILYDGTELKNISASSLYDLVSIIQQNVFVFNSTIRDNITMLSDFP